jgi:heptosyltransferase-2/heptosyltransferase-3
MLEFPVPKQVNSRPLIVRFGAFGDMVILTVLIRALAQRFGQPIDVVSSGGWTRPLLHGQPGVGDIHVIGSRRTPYWLSSEQRQLVATLRARGAGPTWYGDHNEKGRWLISKAGIPANYVVDARLHRIGEQEHYVDYWRRLASLSPAGLDQNRVIDADLYPALSIAQTAQSELGEWLKANHIPESGILLIQAGNKRTMRRGARQRATNTKFWPSERWSAVLRGLRAQHPLAPILLLGVASERALNDEIAALANLSQVFNVAGNLPIQRLLALQSRAAGMISVDTGPAHTGAAVGCNMVVLFGEARPQNYAPRGERAEVRCLTGQHDGKQSMLGILPEDVLAAWQTLPGHSPQLTSIDVSR